MSSSCGYNAVPIWTSSECRNGTIDGFLTHAGAASSRGLSSELEKRCRSPLDRKAYLRCCADIGVSCSRAGVNGECGALRRLPCTTTADTCGACLTGFNASDGSQGPSNANNCVDVVPPVITNCPTDPIFVTIKDGLSSATVNYGPFLATDNDVVTRTVVTPRSGTTFGIGTTKVTVTAFDNSSNSAVCTFSVVVSGPSSCSAGFSRVARNDGFTCERCPAGTYVPAGNTH